MQAWTAGVDGMITACRHVYRALVWRFVPSDERPWGSRIGSAPCGQANGLAAPSASL